MRVKSTLEGSLESCDKYIFDLTIDIPKEDDFVFHYECHIHIRRNSERQLSGSVYDAHRRLLFAFDDICFHTTFEDWYYQNTRVLSLIRPDTLLVIIDALHEMKEKHPFVRIAREASFANMNRKEFFLAMPYR